MVGGLRKEETIQAVDLCDNTLAFFGENPSTINKDIIDAADSGNLCFTHIAQIKSAIICAVLC